MSYMGQLARQGSKLQEAHTGDGQGLAGAWCSPVSIDTGVSFANTGKFQGYQTI